jgi:hypothetical protein
MNPDPFDMLFRAKWNVPQAAQAMGYEANERVWEEVKVAFRDWCVQQPLVYTEFPDL